MSDNMQAEQWWAIGAYNTECQYGYGTLAEAKAYCDTLNADREINCYSPVDLDDADLIAALDAGTRTDGFSLCDAVQQ